MATGIAWTDETVNPVVGCSRISAGCAHCYAERMAVRLASNPSTPQYRGLVDDRGRWTGTIRPCLEALAVLPRWRKPRRVFVGSMTDLFHEHTVLDTVFAVLDACAATPRHTYQFLTKRASIMRGAFGLWLKARELAALPDNWWVGVTVEDQAALSQRGPELQQIAAAVKFVSCEPLLEQLLRLPAGISWVICGGETGPGARPVYPDWVRWLRDQCTTAGVPFFFKQWGEWAPYDQLDPNVVAKGWAYAAADSPFNFYHPDGVRMVGVGAKAAGNLLDGVVWEQMPEVFRAE